MPSPSRSRTAFGTVDRLPSSKWRARYTDPDGKRRSATFPTKTDARAWLATAQADLVRRQWKAPEAGRRTVGAYAADYLRRSDLRESTRALYEGVWRLHLAQTWADVAVADVSPQRVRQWHEGASRATRPTALVQAYRLLRALLNVAVADEVLATNPCRVKAAGIAEAARPSRALTVPEVRALVEAVPARYGALVLVLAFGGLRFGEATALRRRDVLADGLVVRVGRSVRRVGPRWVLGPPKTSAGRREVDLPPSVARALVVHLRQYVPADDDALVFGTSSGNYLASSNFGTTFRRAVQACDLPPVRVHELRHTGATLSAQAGATTAELMARHGHASPAASLRYQHAARHRGSALARALDNLADGPKVMSGSRAPRRSSRNSL